MDDEGNILVKRVAKCNVYVKPTTNNSNEETSIGPEVLKLRDCALELDKPVKVSYFVFIGCLCSSNYYGEFCRVYSGISELKPSNFNHSGQLIFIGDRVYFSPSNLGFNVGKWPYIERRYVLQKSEIF